MPAPMNPEGNLAYKAPRNAQVKGFLVANLRPDPWVPRPSWQLVDLGQVTSDRARRELYSRIAANLDEQGRVQFDSLISSLREGQLRQLPLVRADSPVSDHGYVVDGWFRVLAAAYLGLAQIDCELLIPDPEKPLGENKLQVLLTAWDRNISVPKPFWCHALQFHQLHSAGMGYDAIARRTGFSRAKVWAGQRVVEWFLELPPSLQPQAEQLICQLSSSGFEVIAGALGKLEPNQILDAIYQRVSGNWSFETFKKRIEDMLAQAEQKPEKLEVPPPPPTPPEAPPKPEPSPLPILEQMALALEAISRPPPQLVNCYYCGRQLPKQAAHSFREAGRSQYAHYHCWEWNFYAPGIQGYNPHLLEKLKIARALLGPQEHLKAVEHVRQMSTDDALRYLGFLTSKPGRVMGADKAAWLILRNPRPVEVWVDRELMDALDENLESLAEIFGYQQRYKEVAKESADRRALIGVIMVELVRWALARQGMLK